MYQHSSLFIQLSVNCGGPHGWIKIADSYNGLHISLKEVFALLGGGVPDLAGAWL